LKRSFRDIACAPAMFQFADQPSLALLGISDNPFHSR
jgi:hypothetical protein